MFTLLPSQYKEDIIKNYRKRVLIVFLIGIIAILSISLALSLSIESVVLGKQDELKIEEAFLVKSAEDFSKNDLGVDIEKLNKRMELLRPQKFDFSNLGQVSYAAAPQGVSIEKVEYMNFEVTKFMLTISGTSASRKLLSQFSENLRKDKRFKSVELPLNVLAKDSNIPFSIKVVGSYE